jgi:hypothetical protein
VSVGRGVLGHPCAVRNGGRRYSSPQSPWIGVARASTPAISATSAASRDQPNAPRFSVMFSLIAHSQRSKMALARSTRTAQGDSKRRWAGQHCYVRGAAVHAGQWAEGGRAPTYARAAPRRSPRPPQGAPVPSAPPTAGAGEDHGMDHNQELTEISLRCCIFCDPIISHPHPYPATH